MHFSRLAIPALLLAFALFTSGAAAGERLEELGLTGILYASNRNSSGVLFYTQGMEVKQDLDAVRTELRARAKRPRTGSDHEKDCRAAVNAVLADLHDQAIAKRYQVVANVRSVWRDKVPDRPGVYTCAVGNMLVAVELKGTAFRLKQTAEPAAAPRNEAPVSPVVTGDSSAGKTYSVLLGSATVGAKLQATPDRNPDQVLVALAFRAKEAEAPHKDCALGVVVGAEDLTVAGPRYERTGSQETLFGTLSMAQAERLAAQDGALTACETRVQVTGASRAKISALLEAVRAHANGNKQVQRGDSLSL